MATLHMGSQTWVVLNTDRVVGDIIGKHGKITTERPHMPIANELVSNGKRSVIRRTDSWIEGRRVMHNLLSGSVLQIYGNWQEIESLQLLSAYLKDPKQWYAHNYRYSTAALYRLVMGEKLSKTRSELDDYQRVTMEFIWSINRSVVDFFPQFTWLPRPLQFWRSSWEKMGRFHHKVFEDWWNPIQAAVRNGTAGPGFVRDTLLHPDIRYKGNEEEAMYLATSVMSAGGDNTRMTLNTFAMAMINCPHILERARAELDSVCAEDQQLRLPGMADFDRLPYICAMVKEVLRWRPTVPYSPQHQLTEDLDYAGYHFPKGVNFIINLIALAQGFENANTFDPNRWLNGNEGNVTHDLWAFGGGRRICVGYRAAQQALFVAFARIIFCFDLVPVSVTTYLFICGLES
jgi:cytochrome P450